MEHKHSDWLQSNDQIGETSPRPATPLEPRLRIVPPGLADLPQETIDRFALDVVSDDELIAALVAGEVAALAALYERHGQLVFSMLVRIVYDRNTAEDLLHETFIRVWLHAGSFDESRGTVRGWLHGIAHNLALNELRRRRRRPQAQRRSVGEDPDETEDALGAAADDPAMDAWCAIRDDRLAHELAQLPQGQRTVLTLYAAGFSQSEIATKLDQPLGTVKSRMRRALCQLREVLPRCGVDAGWRAD